MSKTISICIPTYEYNGKGLRFLKTLIHSIKIQKFNDYEIIISDHSVNDVIENWSKKKNDPDIKYFRNHNSRGSIGANTNNAIKHASGEIIKVIYHDDFFVNKNALKIISDFFETNKPKWVMHGFAHARTKWRVRRRMVPKWNEYLLIGANSLGSPSCLAFDSSCKTLMDERLKLLVDTEFYYRMNLEFGHPAIVPDILIANREHPNRTSESGVNYDFEINTSQESWKVNKVELDYILEKHKSTFNPDDLGIQF